MGMTLEDWVRERHPDIVELYEAWAKYDFTLTHGQWVETIRNGFSGYAGRQCQFICAETRDDGVVFQYTFGYIYPGEEKKLWGVKPSELFGMVKPIENPRGIAQKGETP